MPARGNCQYEYVVARWTWTTRCITSLVAQSGVRYGGLLNHLVVRNALKHVIDSNPSKLAKVVQQMRNYYKRMCNSPQEPSWERVQRRYLIGQANSQLITLSDVATLIGKEHKKLHMEPRHFVRRLSYQPIELLNKPDLKSTKC